MFLNECVISTNVKQWLTILSIKVNVCFMNNSVQTQFSVYSDNLVKKLLLSVGYVQYSAQALWVTA